MPGLYRYKIGAFELTAVYDGVWYRPIDEKFIRNADYGDVSLPSRPRARISRFRE